jgi:hypothetical protein
MLILVFDMNLVVPGKIVHKIKVFRARPFIDNLINELGWQIIFRKIFIHIMKVHAHTNHNLFFLYE